jgi:hypothetical protein
LRCGGVEELRGEAKTEMRKTENGKKELRRLEIKK